MDENREQSYTPGRRVSADEWYGVTPPKPTISVGEWYGVGEPAALPVRQGSLPAVPAAEPPAKPVDLKTARRRFSRLGLGAFTIIAVAYAVQLVILGVLEGMDVDWSGSVGAVWALSFIPLYLVAVPLGLLIMRRVPPVRASEIGEMKVSFGRWLVFLLISIGLMYLGSITGIVINAVISAMRGGVETANPLENLLLDSPLWLRLLVVVIIGPVIEELIFRRFLVDRMRRYGEWLAVLVSGLMFGLFHGNFSQFFYAAFLGFVFAYLYLRSGKLRLTVALHCCVNFMGSVIAPAMLKLMEQNAIGTDFGSVMDMMETADPSAVSSSLLPTLAMSAYSSLVLGAAVAGIVLLIVRRKRIFFLPAEEQIPRGSRFSVSWLNLGMILFVLACTVEFVINMFS